MTNYLKSIAESLKGVHENLYGIHRELIKLNQTHPSQQAKKKDKKELEELKPNKFI
ncbi:hypothetical protein KJJ36_01070 [Staphylococcus pseudoxylosus]|uniref:hypothetical protein n=1 Tax=Staphylococcus pseudoxylosus TaxID=2282419 RepID=UPI001F37279E|nr:hypothetical protein [Staphylococcus pseudoxylosus]MCE5000981.1 hypothetical protein [Staphylococcus pseudoxylosus]